LPPLHRRFAAIAVTDADRFGHIVNEDLAVADFAGTGGIRNGVRSF
jgi:hypothetical protein